MEVAWVQLLVSVVSIFQLLRELVRMCLLTGRQLSYLLELDPQVSESAIGIPFSQDRNAPIRPL